MKDETQTSSLNLLLVISVAVLVGLGVTWWAFDHLRSQKQSPEPIAAVVDRAPIATETAYEAVTSDSFDTHLSKAQLAIEANMVFEPAGQNALYFIGLVLVEIPDHAEANAALDSITDRLTESVRQALANNDFGRAYKIAQSIDGVRPNHPLVFEVQEALQRHTDSLLAAAIEYADNGDRNNALASIADAGNLPGADADRLLAMQSEVESRHSDYEAAAAATQQRSREAAALSESSELLASANAALDDGRFTEPAEDNAVYYLTKIDSSDPEAIALKERLPNAVLEAADLSIREGRFDDAEELLVTAAELGVSAERVDASRSTLHRTYANNEAKKIIPTRELVWREQVAPVYPRTAQRRGTEGQVQIAFTVTTTGETTDVVVLESTPANVFDRAAIQAVQQWQFEPRTIRGVVVNQRSAALLQFALN